MQRARWIVIVILLMVLVGLDVTRRLTPYPIEMFHANRELFDSCLDRHLNEIGEPTVEVYAPSERAQRRLEGLGVRQIASNERGYVTFRFANWVTDPVVEIIYCPQGYEKLRETHLAGIGELLDWRYLGDDYYYCVWDF